MGLYGKSEEPSTGKKKPTLKSYVLGTKANPKNKAKSLTPKGKTSKKK